MHADSVLLSKQVAVSRSLSEEGLRGVLQERVTPAGDYHWQEHRDFDEDEGLLMGVLAEERDWNGFVRKIDGTELLRLRSSAAVAATLAFGPSAATTGRIEDAGDSWTFRVTPDRGEAISWSVDKKTWLPLKSVMRGSVRDVTSSYADWTPYKGMLTPKRVVVTDTVHPASEYVLSDAPVYGRKVAADFAALSSAPSDVKMASDMVSVPIVVAANHVIVPVSVNGRAPIGFLLDTGAEDETLNTPRLAAMGLTTYGVSKEQGGGGTTDSSHTQHLNMSVGGAEVRDQHADVLDETGLEQLWGVQLGGILGYDFISRFVVEIDYQAKMLRLYRPQSWRYKGSGVVLPLTFDEGIPYLDTVISVPTKPNLAAHLLVDFGAAGVLTFSSPYVKANDLVRLTAVSAEISMTPGGQQFYTQNNMSARIESLRLGSLVLHSIPVSLSANTTGAYASSNLAATMGNGIYSRFHVFIDYPHHRLILESTANTDRPFPQSPSFGLTLLASGEDLRTFKVAAVRAGSLAETAGFKKDDLIESVDDEDAEEMTLEDLRVLVARNSGTRTFEVKRGSERVKIVAAAH